MRKLALARVSYWHDFLILYRVYMMNGSFHILLFKGTPHVEKMHVWFRIANITHVLPVPVYRQMEMGVCFAFTWYHCEISYPSEILAQYKSQGELTLGWLTPCLVPRPYYSTRPKRFGSCGPIENVRWPFASDTSPKWIDLEGLWKRRTGTRQTHASMKFLMVSCKQI